MKTLWHRAGKALRPAWGGLLLAAWVSSAALAQATPPVDYLGIPGPIEFAGTAYHLAWSAKPTANYTKHEYLPQGQQPASYQDMVMVEMLSSGLSVTEVVKSQLQNLEQRKSQDPLVNYKLLQHQDSKQILLDFLVSDRHSGTLIMEWNAYRYVPLVTANGSKAVMLFAISRRHYGEDDASAFLKALKTRRTEDIDALLKHALPGLEAAP